MINVAIAGGSGNLGKTFAEVLAANPNNNVFILSRKAPTQEPTAQTTIAVDYTSVESLQQAFEANNIDTVISCLSWADAASAGQAELNLIKAAHSSSPTRRFIPSNWGIRVPEEKAALIPAATFQAAAIAALSTTTTLNWTVFSIGYLLDYFGAPHLVSRMPGPSPFVDVAAKVAAIPGTGDERVVLTYSYDVGRYVDALLHDEDDGTSWPRDSRVVGDTVTWNEFVAMAEEARGAKFHVTHDSVESLEKGDITEVPGMKAFGGFGGEEGRRGFFAVIGLSMVAGDWDWPREGSLNVRFPGVEPLSVRAMLEKAWKGK